MKVTDKQTEEINRGRTTRIGEANCRVVGSGVVMTIAKVVVIVLADVVFSNSCVLSLMTTCSSMDVRE